MANPKERWTGQSAYRGQESCDLVVSEYSKGASLEKVCVALGVCNKTYYKWRDTYPEFADAISMGRTASKAWGLDMLLELGMSEKKINQTVLIFAAKHRWDLHDSINVTANDDSALAHAYKTKVDELVKGNTKPE